ncbi:anti-phage-associated DUF3780 domain-containing protein [Pseudomonas plecoglossicida]|uniref:anti-phage-associated DUF3780 domain-containing protein n=1 Tax=Pseudomonas plecoglossicida TaxID=70775 RepID=UPI0009E056D9|nr:anti-phage-associated DUF3780 domain-containing protein [Pseudomonas plecoglossicida]
MAHVLRIEESGMARPPSKTASGVKKTKVPERPSIGFGVPATTDPHHFLVEIPKSSVGAVRIVESLGLQAQGQETSIIERVILERSRWTAIRSEVQRAFNLRLKEHNLRVSAWKLGENPVDRLLGKELCVLAWAVEGMAPENIPIAVRNWLALRPEERWWLFGMTAMSTGGVHDGNKGWRLALRHALGDVAQSELFKPQAVKARKQDTERPMLGLFD